MTSMKFTPAHATSTAICPGPGSGTGSSVTRVALASGADSVSELARRYPISFAAVHKHVATLERAGLVTKTRHGREQRVRGDAAALRSAHRLLDDLEALWHGRIDRIERILAHPTERAPQ
jgi:DNA-binding transcriptional ArsR family regulator